MSGTDSQLSQKTHLEDLEWNDDSLAGVDLRGKSFRDCRFSNIRLPEALLHDCVFEDCIFDSCDLTMADVTGAAFRDILFQRSKLMGINWTPVRGLVFSVTFVECNLTHATFAERKMPATIIRDCRAHETTFADVDLCGAIFSGTDLYKARFMNVNLTEADLSEAENYDISPQQNRLKDTLFSKEAALALVGELGVIVPA